MECHEASILTSFTQLNLQHFTIIPSCVCVFMARAIPHTIAISHHWAFSVVLPPCEFDPKHIIIYETSSPASLFRPSQSEKSKCITLF